MHEGISSIERCAFRECTNLSTVIFPESFPDDTSLGEDIFRNCSSLSSIKIPEGVTNIGAYAFYDCSSLTSVALPHSLTVLSDCAFFGCTDLSSITIQEGLTNIGLSGFRNCSSLASIVLPQSLTVLSDCAFYGCTDLTSINIPKNVSCIKSFTFQDCTSLVSVNIPANVNTIEQDAFYNCISLETVNIPSTLTQIGKEAFYNCSSLKNIALPDSLTVIGEKAFQYCSSLNNIVLPASLTDLGSYAFSNCSSFTSITIPGGLDTINDCAFLACENLSTLIIPGTIKRIKGGAFGGCGLTELILPEGVTTLDSDAFGDCTQLTSITIPDSLTSVSNGSYYWNFSTFCNCVNLSEVHITSIESWLEKDWNFYGMVRDDSSRNNTFHFYIGETELIDIIIPDSITKIYDYKFYKCNAIKSITLSDNIDSIDYGSFPNGCKIYAKKESNTALYLSEQGWSFHLPGENCTIRYMSPYTFSSDIEITSLDEEVKIFTVPDYVTCIGNNAFSDHPCLEQITILDNITSIGYSAFYNCVNLRSIVIPDSVTVISSSAFSGCIKLQSVSLPNSITTIENYAFYGCKSMASIKLPESLLSIGNYAFADCDPSLKHITVPKNTNSIGSHAFDSRLESIAFLCRNCTLANDIGLGIYPVIYCYEYSVFDLKYDQNWYQKIYFDENDWHQIGTLSLPQDIHVAIGESFYCMPDIFPWAEEIDIEWQYNNADIISFDDGLVTGLKAGTVNLSASIGDLTASTIIKIYQPAESIYVLPSEAWVVVKETVPLSVTNIQPTNAEIFETWHSENESIATVDENGLVTTKKTGTVVIYAKTEKQITAASTIHILYPVRSIQFNNETTVNKKLQLIATATLIQPMEDGSEIIENKLVDFSSSDESVLTVNSDGMVYGNSCGTATVTAVASNGISASIELTVVSPISELHLPANLQRIESEAFGSITEAMVFIPSGITYIAEDAFDSSCTLVCKSGSYTEKWAMDHGYAVDTTWTE